MVCGKTTKLLQKVPRDEHKLYFEYFKYVFFFTVLRMDNQRIYQLANGLVFFFFILPTEHSDLVQIQLVLNLHTQKTKVSRKGFELAR